jgi:hypothetical protein
MTAPNDPAAVIREKNLRIKIKLTLYVLERKRENGHAKNIAYLAGQAWDNRPRVWQARTGQRAPALVEIGGALLVSQQIIDSSSVSAAGRARAAALRDILYLRIPEHMLFCVVFPVMAA